MGVFGRAMGVSGRAMGVFGKWLRLQIDPTPSIHTSRLARFEYDIRVLEVYFFSPDLNWIWLISTDSTGIGTRHWTQNSFRILISRIRCIYKTPYALKMFTVPSISY
ncbi:unnamed protein product [Arctogadus glacialis]